MKKARFTDKEITKQTTDLIYSLSSGVETSLPALTAIQNALSNKRGQVQLSYSSTFNEGDVILWSTDKGKNRGQHRGVITKISNTCICATETKPTGTVNWKIDPLLCKRAVV